MLTFTDFLKFTKKVASNNILANPSCSETCVVVFAVAVLAVAIVVVVAAVAVAAVADIAVARIRLGLGDGGVLSWWSWCNWCWCVCLFGACCFVFVGACLLLYAFVFLVWLACSVCSACLCVYLSVRLYVCVFLIVVSFFFVSCVLVVGWLFGFFFYPRKKLKTSRDKSQSNHRTPCYLGSDSNKSAKRGVSPPVRHHGTCFAGSTSEAAKAVAQVTESMRVHRRSHISATWQRIFFMTFETERNVSTSKGPWSTNRKTGHPQPPQSSRVDGASSAQPSVTGAGANRKWLVSDLGLGELAQERHGLHRPPSTHFAGKDHQTGAAVRSRELGVRDLFPAPRACKSCTIHPRAQWTGSAVSPHCRHHGGVNRELSPKEQRQPVCDHLLPGRREPPHSPEQKLLRPNTPETAQADRWWPKASSGRPHRQADEDRGRGHQRRRRRSARNVDASNLNRGDEGKATNGTPANGPDWDLIIACWVSVKRGTTTMSEEAVLNCLACEELPSVSRHTWLAIFFWTVGAQTIGNLNPRGGQRN